MAMTRNVMTCLALAAMLITVTKAATYTVGDADGWSTGVDYPTWASTQTFKAGDKLIFTYLPNHDVVEVTKANYDACSIASPIETHTGGATNITLTTAGKQYFICGTPGHCLQGQQLEVDISASSSSPPPLVASPPPSAPVPKASPPPPSKTKTPPPSYTPETPPPPPSTTKTPPPPSSANPPPGAPPPPKGSSAYKISYGASFGFALILLAAI